MHHSLIRQFYEKSPKSREAVIFSGILYVGMTTGFIFGIAASLIAADWYLCEFKNDVGKNVLSEKLKFENVFKRFFSERRAFDSVNLLVFFTVTFNLGTVLIMRDVYKKKFRPLLAYVLAGILGVDLVCEGYYTQKWFEVYIPFNVSFTVMILSIFFISFQCILSNTIFMHYINLSAQKDKYSVDQATGLIVDKKPEATTAPSYSEISKTCGLHAHDNELI